MLITKIKKIFTLIKVPVSRVHEIYCSVDDAEITFFFLFHFSPIGDVVCSSCQYIYSFSVIEEFFVDAGTQKNVNIRRNNLELFIRGKPMIRLYPPDAIDKKAVPKDQLQGDDLAAVCAHLGIDSIADSAFDDLHMLCNISEKLLYFPMQDAERNFVGYKMLSRGANGLPVEKTVPPSNSFGVIVASPYSSLKRLPKEQTKTAIVVLNMLDVLAIRTQKTNG